MRRFKNVVVIGCAWQQSIAAAQERKAEKAGFTKLCRNFFHSFHPKYASRHWMEFEPIVGDGFINVISVQLLLANSDYPFSNVRNVDTGLLSTLPSSPLSLSPIELKKTVREERKQVQPRHLTHGPCVL